jgi:hypothetical protein
MPLLIDVLCCAVIHCLHKQVVAGVCDAADATTTAFSRMALTLAEIARVRVSYCIQNSTRVFASVVSCYPDHESVFA